MVKREKNINYHLQEVSLPPEKRRTLYERYINLTFLNLYLAEISNNHNKYPIYIVIINTCIDWVFVVVIRKYIITIITYLSNKITDVFYTNSFD